MDRRTCLRQFAAGLTVGVAGLAGCGGEGDGTTPQGTNVGASTPTGAGTSAGGEPTPTAAQTQQSQTDVAMITEGQEYLFDPVGLYVEPGDTVTWVNESGAHSTVAYTEDASQSEVRRIPEGATGWESEILNEPGAEFTHTPETEGTYDYFCGPHKTLGMVGRIVVGSPSGLEADPPDGPVPSEQRIVDEGVVTQDAFTP